MLIIFISECSHFSLLAFKFHNIDTEIILFYVLLFYYNRYRID